VHGRFFNHLSTGGCHLILLALGGVRTTGEYDGCDGDEQDEADEPGTWFPVDVHGFSNTCFFRCFSFQTKENNRWIRSRIMTDRNSFDDPGPVRFRVFFGFVRPP
jgi:hypothetical protein